MTTTKAIVFSSIKYGETSLIVKAFTESDGLVSYLLKGVVASRKGKLKTAYFQPLTQLEVVANHKNRGSLESIREAKVIHPYKTLHADIFKNSMVLFLSEMLSSSVQEQERDAALFNYLENALNWLDQNDRDPNFHLLFLIKLTKFLGFYPDTDQTEDDYFDLQEGRFVDSPSLNPILEGRTLEIFQLFLGINFDALRTIKIARKDRQELLAKVVLYFELHLPGFRKPKSLVVLNAVFD